MNRDPNKELGLYQSNDGHFINYDYKLCAEVDEFVRAPLPDLNKPFFTCLGAAQTLGRFAKEPYPELLSNKLGMQSLNLGRGGVGPEYYLQRPKLLEVVNKSEFVILQVMSGRSVSNSLFKDKGGLNHFKSNLFEGRQLSGKLWKDIFENKSREEFQSILIEQRGVWLDKMMALIKQINRPIVLLYYSHFKPPQKLVFDSFDQLWKFPQLIDKTLIDVVKAKTDAYFEYFSNIGMPQKLVGEEGSTASVKMGINDNTTNLNRYYPSPEMHAELAEKLFQFIKKSNFSARKADNTVLNPPERLSFNRLLKPWVHPNISKFLSALGESDLLLFDSHESEKWLDETSLNCLTATASSWQQVLKRNKVNKIIVASSTQEQILKHKVIEYCAENAIKSEVKGIYSDIVFNWSFRVNKLNNGADNKELTGKYVVLCTPRSGSTVLCDLLEKTNKAGFPKEHLTRPVFEALKAKAFSFADWYHTLQCSVVSENGFFGTKIITERLEWLRSIYSDEYLRSFFKGHKVLRLTRGSVEEQAVSKWFAQISNKWHVKSDSESHSSYGLVKSYSFNAIYKIYTELKKDEVKLNEQISQIFSDQILAIEYDGLVAETESEMRRITDFLDLGPEVSKVKLDTDYKRHDVEAKDEILERFLRDLQ
jgi:LPS sulfotransferase NodH